jgi:hypothetical protein
MECCDPAPIFPSGTKPAVSSLGFLPTWKCSVHHLSRCVPLAGKNGDQLIRAYGLPSFGGQLPNSGLSLARQ